MSIADSINSILYCPPDVDWKCFLPNGNFLLTRIRQLKLIPNHTKNRGLPTASTILKTNTTCFWPLFVLENKQSALIDSSLGVARPRHLIYSQNKCSVQMKSLNDHTKRVFIPLAIYSLLILILILILPSLYVCLSVIVDVIHVSFKSFSYSTLIWNIRRTNSKTLVWKSFPSHHNDYVFIWHHPSRQALWCFALFCVCMCVCVKNANPVHCCLFIEIGNSRV